MSKNKEETEEQKKARKREQHEWKRKARKFLETGSYY